MQVLPNIHKIAILRANALGDFIVALPALEAVRTAYPKAEIVFLGKKWHVNFLEGRPGPVDRVVDVPVSKGVNIYVALHDNVEENPEELAEFFQKMQKEDFDLAVQMHGGGKYSNPFLLKLGAKITAGMKTPDAPALDYWMPYDYWQHETFRLLECAELVGASQVGYEPKLSVTARDYHDSYTVIGETGSPIAVLHPGASDPRRRWSPGNFAVVGDALSEAGALVCITGVDAENAIVDEVIAQMHTNAINLCGKLSLHALTGLIARSTLVVSNDTGPRHLAGAVGTPTVGIYWCGNLINAGPVTRTKHRPFISWTLECPICGKNTLQQRCEHNSSFVDEILPDDVIREALDLLRFYKKEHQFEKRMTG